VLIRGFSQFALCLVEPMAVRSGLFPCDSKMSRLSGTKLIAKRS
jgi:hypothetical protein